MTEFEKKAEEIRNEIAEARKEAKEAKEALSALPESASKEEVTEIKSNIEKLDQSIQDLNKQLKNKTVERKGLEQALTDVLSSEEYKSQLQDVISKKRSGTQTFEVKVDPTSVITSGLSGDVARTVTPIEISAPGYEPNKFLALANVRTIPQDKNRVSWFDGAYYSNVGYIEELTAQSTGSGATLTEKYREIAKVGASMDFSAETVSDMSHFVDWAKDQGVKAVLNRIDELIFGGEGADVTKPKEIYGLKTKGATAFNSATAGLSLAITNANLADLIRAAATQVRIQGKGLYNPVAVALHPTSVGKLLMLKNTQADYIQVLPNGAMIVYGMAILETAKVGADEMFLLSADTVKLYQKRGLEMEVERIASTDSFKMYLRWRGNVVVPTDAIKGNIYVADIDTAIASLDTTSPTTTAAPTTTVAPTTTQA